MNDDRPADDPEWSEPQPARRSRAAHLRLDHAGGDQGHCEDFAKFAKARLAFHQSNHEGALVDLIQAARKAADAIIINPAALSFTSIALFDALKTFEGPIFEVHISNIHARDELHRHSKLSAAVKAVICGLGPYGYIVAMQAALHTLEKLPASLPTPLRVGPR